jgi:hypothetical protein
MTTDTAKIAALNDLCRKAMGVAGRVVQTTGIDALPLKDQLAIREKVETFDAFTPDNDPHKERDFGPFEHVQLLKELHNMDSVRDTKASVIRTVIGMTLVAVLSPVVAYSQSPKK